MEIKIIHDEEYQQFTVEMGEDDAELAYARPAPDTLDFTHTYVPEAARGKGVANKLIEAGLCYARDNNLLVIATCPVVKRFISRNPDFNELLKE